jgi:FtsH-binding integral membrane protein
MTSALKNDIENQTYDYHKLDDDRNTIGNSFSNDFRIHEAIRMGFIRKVYGILSAQMLLTTFMCFLSMFSKTFLKFQVENIWLILLAMVGTIVIPCLVCCKEDLFRQVPTNYIILGVFTLLESYIVGFICGLTNPRVVFMAAFMTLAMVTGLTVYAMTTKTDLTMQGGLLFIVGMGIMLLAIFALFTNNKLVHVFISTLWVILFGVYLVYDTQLIIGNHKLKLDSDEYILASFMLYLDVINLFLNLLQIISYLFDRN